MWCGIFRSRTQRVNLPADAEALSGNQSFARLLKSLEALQAKDVDEARIAVRNAISSHLEYFEQVYWNPRNNSIVSADRNFQRILIVSPFGGARIWDTSSKQMFDACGQHGILEQAKLSPDGKTATWFDDQTRAVGFWKIDEQRLIWGEPAFEFWSSGRFVFSEDSQYLLTIPFSEPQELWSTINGDKIKTLESRAGDGKKTG